MIRRIQITFDILILALVLNAEGSRFYKFFLISSGSDVSAFIFAVAISLIILYLAINGYSKTSKLSVIICITLSVVSYIDPFVKEVLEVDSSKLEEKEKLKKDVPKWKSQWESKDDKEMKKISFLNEIENVKKYNARLDNEILVLQTVGKTKMIAFLFTAFLMSFCVPLLTYLISHKLAKELVGVIEIKRKNENIENIFAKLGGKKI